MRAWLFVVVVVVVRAPPRPPTSSSWSDGINVPRWRRVVTISERASECMVLSVNATVEGRRVELVELESHTRTTNKIVWDTQSLTHTIVHRPI